MIPLKGADILIAFEPAEAVRCLPYLKDGGTVVVNQKAVRPVTASLADSGYDGKEMIAHLKGLPIRLIVVDGDAICQKCGSPRVLNVALLAAAAKSGALAMTAEELKYAIQKRLPEKFHQINFAAIEAVEIETERNPIV